MANCFPAADVSIMADAARNNIDSTDTAFWFQSLPRRKAQMLLEAATHTSREACKRHISLQGHGGNIKCCPASRENSIWREKKKKEDL